jgi:hypothetical protein
MCLSIFIGCESPTNVETKHNEDASLNNIVSSVIMPAPYVISPKNKYIVYADSPIPFKWKFTDVNNKIYYNFFIIEVSTDINFTNLIWSAQLDIKTIKRDGDYFAFNPGMLTDLRNLESGSYFWRVRLFKIQIKNHAWSYSEWSNIGEFALYSKPHTPCDVNYYSKGYLDGINSFKTGKQYYDNPYDCSSYYEGYWAGFNSQIPRY